MKATLVSLVVLLLGTAAARPLAAQTPSAYGVVDPRSMRFRTPQTEVAVLVDTVAATPERVWRALGAVYTTLDIPLSVLDSNSYLLGARGVTWRKLLGGQRLSRYLSCGQGQYGPNADYGTVQLTVLSAIQPIPDGRVAMGTRVAATASGGSGATLNCGSTGALELRIARELRSALGG